MDAFDWAAFAAVWIIVLPLAVPAVLREWMVPWLRGRVVSPRIWGTGDLLLGLGLTAMNVLAHTGFAGSPPAILGGVGTALCGTALMAWAQYARRPGRS
ncbi:hypothetical protein [Streptomyces sp. NPDC001380]|uniref:hypothetical protein n=1 Tax=Streptomyces sp. NPDC001380 TaxID=3364566 RepID=UPI0036AEE4C8